MNFIEIFKLLQPFLKESYFAKDKNKDVTVVAKWRPLLILGIFMAGLYFLDKSQIKEAVRREYYLEQLEQLNKEQNEEIASLKNKLTMQCNVVHAAERIPSDDWHEIQKLSE